MRPAQRPVREHPRIATGFPVHLDLGTRQLEAIARNLSMAGLYLDCALPLPDLVRARIPLPGVAHEVRTTCQVERRERRGIALSFAAIDWEDLLLVARYLSPRL